jgi:hypothetical protein
MANTSLGTLAIVMTLWAADLGAGQMAGTPPVGGATAFTARAPADCHAGAQRPLDDSDLEVVVCGRPLR